MLHAGIQSEKRQEVDKGSTERMDMSKNCVFVLLCLIRTEVSAKTATFKVLENVSSRQAEGDQHCTDRLGPGWYLPDGQSMQHELHLFLKNNRVQRTWLAPVKEIYLDWTWVNGKTYKASRKDILSQYMPDKLCAGISLQHDNQPIGMACTDRSVGFCCQFKEGHLCKLPKYQSSCELAEDQWFLLQCEPVDSWQHARSRCLQFGGDLAVMDTPAKFNKVFELVNREEQGRRTSNQKFRNIECWAFIGLRKQEWIIKRNFSVPHKLDYLHPNGESPSGNGSCLSVDIKVHHETWETTNCNETLPVVCQYYGLSHAKTSKSPHNLKVAEQIRQPNVGFIVMAVVIVLLVVGLLAMAGIMLWKRKNWERNMQTDKAQDAEKTALILEQKKMQIPKMTERITVVMFASGVESIHNCIVENIPVSRHKEGTPTAESIKREYDEFLHTRNSDSDKVDSGRDLRIVCITGLLDEDEKLSNEKALETLQMLALNKDAIDIIYLPGMATDITQDCLQLLQELRQSCILICFAKANVCEVTAAESLSFIGKVLYSTEQIYTGLVDIRVSLDETPGIQKAHQAEAAARAAGFIAGLLEYAEQMGNSNQDHSKTDCAEISPIVDLKTTAGMRKFLINLTQPQSADLAGFGLLKLDRETHEKAVEELSRSSKPARVAHEVHLEFSSEITRKSVKSCLKLSNKKIKIAICSSPTAFRQIEANVVFNSLTEPGNDLHHGNIVKTLVFDILLETLGETSMRNNIEIYDYPIRSKDLLYKWQDYWTALDKIKKELPDIVYLSGTKRPPPGNEIKSSIEALPQKIIMLTGAMLIVEEPPETNCSFPAENMITVSYENGPKGSLIEFISNTPLPKEYDNAPKETYVDTANAAADAICAIVAVLFKIHDLGLDEAFKGTDDKTGVMRNILINLCDGFPNHSPERGFGILKPSAGLLDQDQDKMKNIIQNAIKNPPRYWKGKNI